MLPGFCEHYKLYKNLNHFLQIHPEVKNDNAEIYCYYGNAPFCSWDGGRIFNKYNPLTTNQLVDLVNYYESINGRLRLVLTNNQIEEQHCYDRYNNLVLQICDRKGNEIVLNSNILENYIRQNTKNYSFISSTTKCLSKSDSAKEELNNDNYKFVCLDYNLNHNWKFLEELTPEEKAKTEFLINPICGPGCSQRKEHYRLNSLFSLSYGVPYKLQSCEIYNGSMCAKFNSTHISPDEIYSKYVPAGFHYFKIEGRTWPSAELIPIIASYIIKPEYMAWFIQEMEQSL